MLIALHTRRHDEPDAVARVKAAKFGCERRSLKVSYSIALQG